MTTTDPDCPKVAVVGAGYWGRNLVRNFHNLGALSLVCDRDDDALRQALKDNGGGFQTTTHWTGVLADSQIKGVVLATPAETHYEMVCQAIDAGKHVFVEKPMALAPLEGEDIVRKAEERHRVLMVGHILNFHPAVEAMLVEAHSGRLGDICYIYSNRLNLGKFRREENVLWSFAPHDIAMVLRIIGKEPASVDAYGTAWLKDANEDVTVTHMTFPGNIHAHIFVSWLHPFKEQRFVIVGSEGMLVFDDTKQTNAEKLVVYEHAVVEGERGLEPVKHPGRSVSFDPAEPMRGECAEFLARIRSGAWSLGAQFPSTGHEALRVLQVLDAAQRSMGAREPVADLPTTAGTCYVAHPTAVIDDGAEVGEDTHIWHFSHVMPGAKIGERCILGQNVYVASDVEIGNNVKVQNNVSIYDGVRLEDDVFCGPSMVFTNVRIPRSHVVRRSEYQQTVVKRGATLGANCTIVCGVTIGECAFIGAGAVVTKDVEPYTLVVDRDRHKGYRCQCGGQLLWNGGDLWCGECNDKYHCQDGLVSPMAA